MKTTIYWYSATGNSLVIARRIAGELGEAEVVPLAKFKKAAIRLDAARVGLVFPIYAWGPPRTVEEFIANVEPSAVRYFFTVASCGGTAANALPRIRSALRKKGGDLHAGFIVRSKGYLGDAAGEQNKMIQLVRKHSGKPFGTDMERLPAIIDAIKNELVSRPERNALVGSLLGSFFHEKAMPQFARMDERYGVTNSCDGCGFCARLCPRENIAMENGKPTWRHDCDGCGACVTWCPKRAISVAGGLAPTRGHHAEVALSDIILR